MYAIKEAIFYRLVSAIRSRIHGKNEHYNFTYCYIQLCYKLKRNIQTNAYIPDRYDARLARKMEQN